MSSTKPLRQPITRRHSLARLAGVGAAVALPAQVTVSAAAAAGIERTPSQTEGPYYPVAKPEPPSNDLIHAANGARAEGVPLELTGKVMDAQGKPLPGALVEIWQCDNRQVYRHPRAPAQGQEDPAFAGYGEHVAGADGDYTFLTIVPVAYPGRPPHIHAKVKIAGREALTTQLYIAEHAENGRDGVFSTLLFGGKDQLMMRIREGASIDGVPARKASFDFVV